MSLLPSANKMERFVPMIQAGTSTAVNQIACVLFYLLRWLPKHTPTATRRGNRVALMVCPPDRDVSRTTYMMHQNTFTVVTTSPSLFSPPVSLDRELMVAIRAAAIVAIAIILIE